MKKLLLLFLLSIPAFAQWSTTARHITYGTSTPATCNVTSGDVFFKTSATVTVYYCSASNTWTAMGGGGGSGTVTSIGLAGTANQITVTGTSPITDSGSWTLSFPTNVTLPGTTTGTFSGNVTGNASGTAGSLPTTSLLGGVTLSGLTGLTKLTAGVPSVGAASDVYGLFSGCSGTLALLADGTCGSSGSGIGTAPYSTTTITASPMTISAATHGQGLYAFPTCWDTSTPRVLLACGFTRDSSGNLVLTYTSPTPGRVDVFGATGGFANPMSAAGDMIVGGASGVAARFAATATANQTILSGSSTAPSWTPYTIPATIAAHQTLVATGTTAVAAKTIPDCTDTGGNHLNFAQSTDAFSCGTSGGGGVTTTSPLSGTTALSLLVNVDHAFTAAQSVTVTGIGTGQTSGLELKNTTAAALGAQQWSPGLILTGNGRDTSAASSKATNWIIQNRPVQTAGNPTSVLEFYYQTNAAGYAEVASLSSGGTLALTGAITGATSVTTSSAMTSNRANQSAFSAEGSGGGFAINTTTPTGGFCFNGSVQFTQDTCTHRNAAGVVEFNGGTKGTIAGGVKLREIEVAGTVPGISGCSAGTQTGGGSAGTYSSGTTGTCTVTLTFAKTAATGWSCFAANRTTAADIITQTSSTTTTAVLAGASISGDVISYGCVAY